MKLSSKLTIILLSVLTVGCGISRQHSAVHDFGNDFINSSKTSAHLSDITVEAPKWLQDTRIRYRLLYSDSTEVRFYTLDRWIAPPNELVKQSLVFENTISFPVVITLTDFEQRFISPTQAKVIVGFSVEAYSHLGGNKLGSRIFFFEQPTNTADAEGAVRAFSQIMRTAPKQLEIWLQNYSQIPTKEKPD